MYKRQERQNTKAVYAVQSSFVLVVAGFLGLHKALQPFQLGKAQAGLHVGLSLIHI